MTAAAPMSVQATALALAIDADGPLAGVLLLGPPGSGKTSLALSAIGACPWRRTGLIADDRALLVARKGRLKVAAPDAVAGLAELRGFGPAPVPRAGETALICGFRLAADPPRLAEPERLAGPDGLVAPVWPFRRGGADAERLRIAVRAVLGGQTP